MSFLIWLSWKQKTVKIIASFAAENLDKEGRFQLHRGQKLLHCMKRRIQKGHYSKNISSARL